MKCRFRVHGCEQLLNKSSWLRTDNVDCDVAILAQGVSYCLAHEDPDMNL